MSSFLISPAYAQAAGGGMFNSSSLLAMAPYLLIFVIFYFVLIRPQQQKQKQLKSQLGALRRGDRVVTAGGIIGIVQKSREGVAEVEVEIAPNVRVTVLRETISTILSSTVKPANDAGDASKNA